MKNYSIKRDSDPAQTTIKRNLNRHGFSISLLLGLLSFLLFSPGASAIPAFARQYNLTCATCHAAFPKLNSFGRNFIANNYRLENWKEGTLPTGDDMLALQKLRPLPCA